MSSLAFCLVSVPTFFSQPSLERHFGVQSPASRYGFDMGLIIFVIIDLFSSINPGFQGLDFITKSSLSGTDLAVSLGNLFSTNLQLGLTEVDDHPFLINATNLSNLLSIGFILEFSLLLFTHFLEQSPWCATF